MTTDSIRNVIIGILVVAVFVGGFSIFWTDIAERYGQPYSATTAETFSRIQQINGTITQAFEGVQTAAVPTSSNPFDIFSGLLGALFNTLKSIATSISVLQNMITAGLALLPLGTMQALIVTAVISILTIFITFALIKIAYRG